MKTLVGLLVAISALTLAGTATAKGLPPDRVCGASSCVELDAKPESAIILDYNAMGPAPPVSGYYRLDYRLPAARPQLFVPQGNRLGDEIVGGRGLKWYALYGTGPERLQEAIRGLEPFPAPAQWPLTIDRSTGAAASDGRDLNAYALSAGLIALVLIGFALAARRFRLRRTTTA